MTLVAAIAAELVASPAWAALCNAQLCSRSYCGDAAACGVLESCMLVESFRCADGSSTGDPGCRTSNTWGMCNAVCDLFEPFDSCTVDQACTLGVGSPEVCNNAKDDDFDGCADEGCEKEYYGDPACTCQPTSCAKPACSPVPKAECDPQKSEPELCGNGEDDNCSGEVDEGCLPPGGPPLGGPLPRPVPSPSPGPGPCCGCKGGADPILLTSRSAVTNPFTDFSVTAVSRLALSRTWSSMDASHFGGPIGILGRGWHHEWEGTLSCRGDGCTVARGAIEGSRFERAETAVSLDGAEVWQLYRPRAGDTGAARRQLLARRPSGEWIQFQADGTTLHFATACDACGTPDAFCAAPEDGGRARLVKVVDPQGNAIHVTYARGAGLLLGLTDDLGHSLEVRSSTACTDGLARELYYDGFRAVTWDYDGVDLLRATDADGAVLRSYDYDPTGSGLLIGVRDEAGSPIVEFAYDGTGDAIGIVDEATTMLLAYGADGTVGVSESYGTSVASGERKFDARGSLLSIAEGCSCGGAKTFTYLAGDLVCARDVAGNVTYDGRDELGRVARHARYSGQACPPTVAALGTSFEEEWRSYGVAKAIAQGVELPLDLVTLVTRKSTLSSANLASESWDYDPTPKSYDPVGYACAEAPLPAGAVVCRHIQAGQVSSTTGAAVLERHATFYSYDGRGRVTRAIGPVNLDRPSASDVVPVEERQYWPDTESLARRGRLAEIRRYPSPTAAPLATTFDYDMFGPYRRWQPDGLFTTWLKDGRGRPRFVLESSGRTTETRYHDGDKPRLRILAGGEVERTGYDSRGRVTAEERLSGDPDVSGASPTVLWGAYHAHDAAGNRVHSERRDGAGVVVWKQDREFDVQHRLVKESHPEVAGAARAWEYDPSGFLERTIDEEGRATTFTPEFVGRVKSVTRSGSDAAGAPVSRAVATYGYQNYSGLLATLQDAYGTYAYYRHDDFGRLETLRHAQFKGGTLSRTWDARGNLLQRKDNYVTVTQTHDGLDRILTTTASNALDKATLTYVYVYDEEGAPGRLTSVIEPERTVRFTFTEGRLATERLEENGVATALVTEHLYDAAGRLSGLRYPSGLRLAYDRDPVTHSVKTLRNAETGEVYAGEVDRLAGGPVTGFSYANGATLSEGFNARWEPTSVMAGPVSLLYEPTPSGNVGQITEDGLVLPFSYDYQGRLSGSSGWFSYVYLHNENRYSESVEGTSLQHGLSWDRLKDLSTSGTTPVKRHAFVYDYQTNVTGVGKYNAAGTAMEKAICLRHDPLGRLVTVGPTKYLGYVTPDATYCTLDTQLASVAARFKYDFRNRRVASWRATTNEWVYTVFDQGGQPLAELALTSDPVSPWRPVREYVWLDGKPVAQIERDAATGASRVYAVHVDAIGLPRALTSPSGATVWSAAPARPYGDLMEATTPDPETGRTVVTNLRLPGQYDERLLGALGLQGPYYNWNRWYLPSVGRYLELDPIAKAGGFNGFYGPNWYGYANGNPLRYTDRKGLYGTNDCSYYQRRCAESGGEYYCDQAQYWCNWFDTDDPDPDPSRDDDYEGWTRCTRQCLQDCDRDENDGQDSCPPTPDDRKGPWDPRSTSFDCHQYCYQACADWGIGLGDGPPYDPRPYSE